MSSLSSALYSTYFDERNSSSSNKKRSETRVCGVDECFIMVPQHKRCCSARTVTHTLNSLLIGVLAGQKWRPREHNEAGRQAALWTSTATAPERNAGGCLLINEMCCVNIIIINARPQSHAVRPHCSFRNWIGSTACFFSGGLSQLTNYLRYLPMR